MDFGASFFTDKCKSEDMRRRKILGILAGVVFAGCSGTPQNHNRADSAWQVTETSDENGDIAQGAVDLAEGQYASYEFSRDEAMGVTIDVTVDGPGQIDVWTIPQSNIDGFRSGDDDTRFNRNLSERGVRDETIAFSIQGGEWAVILDNTPQWGAEPEGTVVVEARIHIAQ